MPSIQRELKVPESQEPVWNFVKDMGNWASQMPGYLSHEQVNDDDSVWTVQFNIGPFTRPCVMDVHVSHWGAPSEVSFTVKGRFDPFAGQGVFTSAPDGTGTAIRLEFGVEGTGSMAKVVSAMAGPVLKTVGDQFVSRLAAAISSHAMGDAALAGDVAPAIPESQAHAAKPGRLKRFFSKLLGLLRRDTSTSSTPLSD